MVCNCNSRYCPECCCNHCNKTVSTDALLDPKDRKAIDDEYQAELKVLALKDAFSEFSRSCHHVVLDGNGYREFDDRFDNFDFRASEKVIGNSDKFRVFKKLLEDLKL